MIDAIEKTLTLILLIGLGVALRRKIKNKSEIQGLKEVILSVALPATVFIALMGIKISLSLLIYPIILVCFNFFIFLSAPYFLTFFGIDKGTPSSRTLTMLLPSLAPGLSSFPFISEFLGGESLALAAMADVGNKFFALNFLYYISLKMHMAIQQEGTIRNRKGMKDFLWSLIKEPINVIMLLAIVFLSMGFHMGTLPLVIQEIFSRASTLMGPLVLIYIGMAVEFKEGKEIRMILSILFFRAGLSLLFSLLVIYLCGIHDPNMILLSVVVPLSACSFWPFAHIAAIHHKEDSHEIPDYRKTFDANLALLTLAISLPLSTILVIGVLASGQIFAETSNLILLSITLLGVGMLPHLKVFKKVKSSLRNLKEAH
ncbi:AEC family transporter [Aquirufa salirivi]|uniref:Permease n=1 Tax=Aquirufa salirivi TaxID=3104729 RepID=A0ABW8RY31_9BACT